MNAPILPPRFRRIALLGRGGTAEVVRAYSEDLRRDVALKLPLPDSDSAADLSVFAALTARERLLIFGCRFPGLVRILDSSQSPPWLAMELCGGPTLDSLGRIDDLPMALNILSALALNLEFLRAAGLVHGDLKPQNVFLPADQRPLRTNRLFWLKLSDFSLGRRIDEPDSARAGLGTVGYMAPETIADGLADHRSDLFSLGVVAYTMLTGVHPFLHGETDPAVINSRCREEEPPPVSDLRPEAAGPLTDLVAGLLNKQPDRRPPSAWSVCESLEKLGTNYPFRRALSPTALIARGASFTQAVETVPVEWAEHRSCVADFSLKSVAGLRLVLAANFRRNNLVYDGSQFVFRSRPYWPNCHRRAALRHFCRLAAAQRKTLIAAAVEGEPPPESSPLDVAALLMLPHLLRPRTIRRLSLRRAARAEEEQRPAAAARLAVQAGDLKRAECCCLQAATALQKEHQARPAIRLIDTVVDFADLTYRLFDVRALLKMKGDLLKNSGDLDTAEDVYRRVVQLYDGRDADLLIGRTYNALGDLYKLRQRFAEGIDALQKALRIYEAARNDLEISHTYNNIGNLHYIAGDRIEAFRQYRRALRIQHRLGGRAEIASTLNNIGVVMVITGRLARAARLFALSLRYQRELGDPGEIARTLNNLGYLYSMLGRRHEAIDALTESLGINRRIGNKKEMLFNLDNLTASTIAAGDLKGSLVYLREGTALAREIDDTPHQVIFHRNTSTALRRMGRIGEALERQRAAERLVAAVDDREEQIRLIVNAAALRAAVGDIPRARELARDAADAAATIHCKPEKLNALLLFARLSDDPAALDESASLAEELGLDRERLLVQANRLEALVRAGQVDPAVRLAGELAPAVDAMSEDLEKPRLLLVLTGAYALADDQKTVRSLAERAAALAARSGLVPENAMALTYSSRYLTAERLYEEAFAASSRALQLLKGIADTIPDPGDRRLFMTTPAVVSLVGQIKDLQARIGQKKGAGW